MATSLSSRSRRTEYGRSSAGGNLGSFAGVAPYPSPVSLRSTTHSSSVHSAQQPSGPIPGPVPGNASKPGSSSFAGQQLQPVPPPPSQDFCQYAQHFPPLHSDQKSAVPSPSPDKCVPPTTQSVVSATHPTNEVNWHLQQLHPTEPQANHPSYMQQQPGPDFYGQHLVNQQQSTPPTIDGSIMPPDQRGGPGYYPSHYYIAQPDSVVRQQCEYSDYVQHQQSLPSTYDGFSQPPHQRVATNLQPQRTTTAPPLLHHEVHSHPKMNFTPQPMHLAHPSHQHPNMPSDQRMYQYPPRHYVQTPHHPSLTNNCPPNPASEGNNTSEYSNHQSNSDKNNAGQSIRVRAIVSGWKAGTIIGRQGQVISTLRSESQCKITISDDPTTINRVLTIVGPPRKVAEVLRRVCFMIGTSASAYYSGRENPPDAVGAKSPAVKQTSTESTEHNDTLDASKPSSDLTPISFTLAVPSPLCGCLIGKAGIQIKNFRQTFGVAFSVSSHSILESSDRPVNISGPPENVANCLEEVCILFSEPLPPTAIQSRSKQQQQDSGEPYYEVSDGGRNSYGAFRSNWRRNLSDADAADQVHHHGESEGEEEMGGAPVVEDRRLSLQQYDSKQNIKKPRRRQSRRGGGGPVSQDDRSNGGLSGSNGEILGSAIEECSFTLNTGETEVHLLVPNDIVGCIIGKGGQTISEIRTTSGAMISITESAFPPPMPLNAIHSSYPPGHREQQTPSSGGDKRGAGLRSRDRVICIRGRSKNIRTARYLMGSSILSAQKSNGGNHHPNVASVPTSGYRPSGNST